MRAQGTESYIQMEKAAMSDREAEAAALMKAAVMMKQVQSNWNAPDRDVHLQKALKHNQRLWSFFQATIADAANPLPSELKEKLLTLSLFIDRRAFDLLAYPEPAKLDILININTNIAAGLKGNA